MINTQQLKFLQSKIADLGSALFSNESEAVLKLPTTVIRAMTVDDAGQIWFSVTRPPQMLHEFDREFPAKLKFFKKDKEYFSSYFRQSFYYLRSRRNTAPGESGRRYKRIRY